MSILNQRIKVGTVHASLFENQAKSDGDMVIIYRPKLNEYNDYVYDSYGAVIVERIGGVKAGSTGVVTGPSLKAHRSNFIEYKNDSATTAMALDLVHIYPIQFDAYQGIGWVLGDTIKLF